jgi:predicted phosphodiesterase
MKHVAFVHKKRMLYVLLVLLAVCASGCSSKHALEFSFIAVSDMRCYTPPEYAGPEYFAGVCQAIRKAGAGAFIIVAGDLDPPDMVRDTIDNVLGKEYPWYPVIGNHDLEKLKNMAYLRSCNTGGDILPHIVNAGPSGAVETCYSFDYGDAHFVAINEYYDGISDIVGDGDVVDALYEWLADDLRSTKKTIIFVIGHEPTIIIPDMESGRLRHQHSSLNKYGEKNHRFWQLLKKHGVVAYICGHTHGASVAKLNGVWQIDTGHSRGKGDSGAKSTFVKFHIDSDGSVMCYVYRSGAKTWHYELVYSDQLK